MPKEELFLLTKLDMAGEPMGPSLRFRCEDDDAAILRIIGELSGFSPEKRDGTPNPAYVPFCPESFAEGPNIRFEWDVFCDCEAKDGAEPIVRCTAAYYREDIEPYYFQLENPDRIRRNPKALSGEFSLIGTEDGCLDV